MRKKLTLIFFGALFLRLLLAPLTYHGDAIDFLNWGENLQEFGLKGFYTRDTPEAGPPNYPPGFYYVLLANQKIYECTKNILWQINVNIPPFPSNLYTWFESDKGRIFFNKLPAIFADLAIGYLIYLLVNELMGKRASLISSSLFLFSPPIWYNSAVWGQTESLFALPLLASFYLIHKKKYVIASLIFLSGFLIKPTVILVLPVFIWWWVIMTGGKDIIKGVSLSIILFYSIHVPFQPVGTLSFIADLYRYGIREVLGYIVANAFNFWAFFFGFEPQLDSLLLFGARAYLWGLVTFALFVLYFMKNLKRKTKEQAILFAAGLLAFTGFLFLTRIHERYFYITLLFLAPLTGIDRRIKKGFIILSGLHFINLYHFWWVPKVEIMVELLSNNLMEKVLILLNIATFYWLLNIFRKRYAKDFK